MREGDTTKRLRQAADRLDELAEAASPGDWRAMPSGRVLTPMSGGGILDAVADTFPTGNGPKHNAAYIAAMHPGVSKALAAWLQACYVQHALTRTEVPDSHPALAVADAILGHA